MGDFAQRLEKAALLSGVGTLDPPCVSRERVSL